jgi:hypothetical protein
VDKIREKMIKANELRIGNLVKYDNCVKVIDVINDSKNIVEFEDGDTVYAVFHCQPIPLTEEWLLKFGFVDKNYTLELKAKRKTIVFNWFSKVVSTGKRSGYYSRKYRHIKYVHQLQNLYFALTGEELEVKNG